jgi:transposase InsO family protein
MSTKLVYEWHVTLGHNGTHKLEDDMKKRFHIPNLRSLVTTVVQGCQLCQAIKKPNWSKQGTWESIPVPPRPGTCISMDVVDIAKAKTWDGKDVDCAVVVVDRHSGWIDAYPAKKLGLSSKTVAHMMHERWLPTMGVPQEIMTDPGAQFRSQWFKTFCALKGIVHAEAVSYRSATNGRAEGAIASVLDALRKIQNDKHIPWPEALPQALQMVRTAAGPTGLSPSQVVVGRDVLQQGLPLPQEQDAEDATAFHERMRQVDAEVQTLLSRIHTSAEDKQKKPQHWPTNLVNMCG